MQFKFTTLVFLLQQWDNNAINKNFFSEFQGSFQLNWLSFFYVSSKKKCSQFFQPIFDTVTLNLSSIRPYYRKIAKRKRLWCSKIERNSSLHYLRKRLAYPLISFHTLISALFKIKQANPWTAIVHRFNYEWIFGSKEENFEHFLVKSRTMKKNILDEINDFKPFIGGMKTSITEMHECPIGYIWRTLFKNHRVNSLAVRSERK